MMWSNQLYGTFKNVKKIYWLTQEQHKAKTRQLFRTVLTQFTMVGQIKNPNPGLWHVWVNNQEMTFTGVNPLGLPQKKTGL